MGPEQIDAFRAKLLAAESFSAVVSVRLGRRILRERQPGSPIAATGSEILSAHALRPHQARSSSSPPWRSGG